MNQLQRRVRAHVLRTLLDTSVAPSVDRTSLALGAPADAVRDALRALAGAHRLVMRPGTDTIWMAHPFSAIPTDFAVTTGTRTWWANCVWDGLSILGLVGDGHLDTHSPGSGEAVRLSVAREKVSGEAFVHFLVPARHFWDDIGFT